MHDEPKKAAIYLRCSTDRGHTDNQRPAVEQLARARGFEVVRVFQENASAAKRRAEWEKLKQEAHAGGCFSAVIVFALDRLGRSMAGNLTDIIALDRMGVQVISVREPWLDMQGPVRDLLIAIFSWVAQEERRQIASRVRAGQDRARRAGKHCGRPRHPVDLARVHELQAQGLSLRATAKTLNISRSVLHRALHEEGGREVLAFVPPSANGPTPRISREIEASISPS